MVVTLPTILTLLLLLIVSASLSATEAAILAINKVRLRHRREEGSKSAKLTFDVITKMDRAIGTILVANNLVNVTISAIGAWICVSIFGPERGLAIATISVTAVLLLFGEMAPKMYATSHAELVAFTMVRPLRILMLILYPIASFFMVLGRLVLRLLRIPARKRSPLVTEEELKVMIQMGREAGVLTENELRMLHGIFEFSDALIRQVMVLRIDIAGIDLNSQSEEVLDVLIEEGHSRIVVFRDNLDDIVGVIYARDMLAMVRHGGLLVLTDLIRPVEIVQETKRVAGLLSEFQLHKHQIAVVQNAKGRTTGLVTMEDLLEEIVGEIHEEKPHGRKMS